MKLHTILIAILLSLSACNVDMLATADADLDPLGICYPVDDTCSACSVTPASNSRCFERHIMEQMGCGVCVYFRCWGDQSIRFCSKDC